MVRDGTTGDWIGSCMGHKGAVWCCRIDTQTQTLIGTASGDYSAHIYDGITGQCLYQFQDAKHILKTCDFNTDTTLFATGGHEGMVRIYNLIEQEALYSAALLLQQSQQQHVQQVQPQQQPQTKASKNDKNPNNHKSQTVTTCTPNSSSSTPIRMTNVTPHEIMVLPMTGTTSTTVKIMKLNWYDTRTLIIGGSDGTIRFYDATMTTTASSDAAVHPIQILQTPHVPNGEIRDMEYKSIVASTGTSKSSTTNNNDWKALSVAVQNSILIYNVTDLTHIPLQYQYNCTTIHFRNEGGLSLHPSGLQFCVGGSDLYVYLYNVILSPTNNTESDDTTTMPPTYQIQEMDCYKGHHGPIRCLRYSPDGTTLASGSEDGTIRLWQNTVPIP
jgi:WD40 repeat protein